MARRPAPAVKHPAVLTPPQLQLGIERLGKLVERIRQFDPQGVTDQYNIPHGDYCPPLPFPVFFSVVFQ